MPDHNDESQALAPEGRAQLEDPSKYGSNAHTKVVDAALRLVTALAQATVNNAHGVSVTLERHGRLMTVAASNDEVLEMDRHQYESAEGPCLDAKAEGRWYYIESLDEETRWPTFVPLALAQGIHSVLSSPLLTAGLPKGALNIYSERARAFGTHEQELAELFATQASGILTTAAEDTSADQAKRRSDALRSRQLIAHAEGMIMAREHLSPSRAAAHLHRSARAEGRTVADLAAQIVASVSTDHDDPT